MKKALPLVAIFFSLFSFSQEKNPSIQFWDALREHCGNAYAGTVVEAPENDDFRGKNLVMHIRSCEDNVVRIPFTVGEDRSRTWVLTLKDNRIQLKHDHRHEDGSEDKITQYGGITPNTGLRDLQIFPADQETAELLPLAATNVWWITLDENSFSYNLKRLGSDRLFTVEFDLSRTIDTPAAPWGWEH